MLQQRQKRALAGIEADKIDKVEQPGFLEFAQFGVDVASAQGNAHVWVVALDSLGNAQRPIHRARERRRQDQKPGLMFFEGRQRQVLQQRIEQIGRRGQRLGQRIKARCAGGQ